MDIIGLIHRDEWGYDPIRLTIFAGSVSETLVNFPVLLKLSDDVGKTHIDLSGVVSTLGSSSNRKRILITDSVGTPCYAEIVEWDQQRSLAYIWFRAPIIAHDRDTYFYVYYDPEHEEMSDYVGDVRSAPAMRVWENGYTAVWHMRSSNGKLLDSTSNMNDGTLYNVTETDGIVGRCLSFNGSNSYIEIPHKNVQNVNHFTLDMVIYFRSLPPNYSAIPICKGSYIGPFWLELRPTPYINTYARVNGVNQAGSVTTPLNTWWNVGMRFDGTTVDSYRDGKRVHMFNIAGTLDTLSYPIRIGKGGYSSSYGRYWTNANIAEIRLSSVPRSSAWFAATHAALTDTLMSCEIIPKREYRRCQNPVGFGSTGLTII